MKVTIDEITDLLQIARHGLDDTQYTYFLCQGLYEHIKKHGIAPPEGYCIVPVKDLRTIEHRLLNAERVFKRDLVNHKFMGFDLISSSIDMVSAMLSAVKEKE